MTAPLTDYTTYDDIRAALGVAPEELEDATLTLAIYQDNLEVELEEVNINLPSQFATTSAVATPSDTEQRFLQATRLFAVYAVARHLTQTLPMFGPKDLTDGKAALARVNDPHKLVIEAVNRQYGRFRARLEDQYSKVTSTSVAAAITPVYLSVVSPSVDPVTGV